MSTIRLIGLIMFVLVLFADCYGQDDEGSYCQQLGYAGICTKVENCSVALDALSNKGRHELKRCGFVGAHEIVCCPDLTFRQPVPVHESTTIRGAIWSSDPVGVDNREQTKMKEIKRKSDIVCEQNYIDFNIKPEVTVQIFNGKNARMGQFPHAAALGFENSLEEIEWRCGASLISLKFLLTAAHCFICNGCSDPKKVRLGVIDINNDALSQDMDVKNVTPHPDYDVVSKHNDIGIVELVREVQTTKNIHPACLYTKNLDPKALQIIGWGQTVSNEASSKSPILKYAVIQPVDLNECNSTIVSKNKFSSKVILKTQICGTTESDACLGDSGGPLQILSKGGSYEIVGIVSYGVQCGTKVPGIYTRIYTYLDWIEKIVWPKSIK